MPNPSRPRAAGPLLGHLVVALAGVVALGFALLTAPAWAARPAPEVDARLQARGTARVLVVLDAAAPPRGLAESAVARASRQRDIARRGDAVLRRVGAGARHRVRAFADLPLLALDVDAAELAVLSAAPEVLAIEPDRLMRPGLDVSTPIIGAKAAADAGYDGAGALVAVLDTGVDPSHPMFAGRIVAEACFSTGSSCPNGQSSMVGPGAGVNCTYDSTCFHGSHVAGIALGFDSARQGVAPAAGLVSVQIFTESTGADCSPFPSPCPLAYTSDMLIGMLHVESLGLPVAAVNLSLGGDTTYGSQLLCDSDNAVAKSVIDQIALSGIATVAAAGNAGTTTGIDSPACISTAIGVGATEKDDGVWASTNSAGLLDFWAPGVLIQSAAPFALYPGGWVIASGTSMATPQVAGALAALRSADPTIDIAAMRSALSATGLAITDTRNNLTRPRIQVDQAVKSLAPSECFDGVDNEADGDTDFPADPGCATGLQAVEKTACDDGLDNDGDTRVDWDGGGVGVADPQCHAATGAAEASAQVCGLGPELVPVLALLAAAGRTRRRRPRGRRQA